MSSNILVDVHAHLDHCNQDDLYNIVERAKKAGVNMIITNGIDPETNRKALELAKKYDIVKAALGLYPIDALKMSDEDIDCEMEFIKNNKDNIIAVGEIGIDYHRDRKEHERQKMIFKKMLGLADEIEKPVIIHSRKAEEDCISILEGSKLKKPIIIHCFGGNRKLVERIRDNGWFFSIPANIIRDSHFQMIVEHVPITQLLTETDAPYLSPYKDKPSEPSFITETIKKMAEIKGMDEKEVMNSIFMNYQKVF